MVDYSLCNGENCHMRGRCLRYKLLPRADPIWQSYVSAAECIEKGFVIFLEDR